MHSIRRSGLTMAASVLALLIVASADPASATRYYGGLIAPNERFGAAINGRTGSTLPVTISMACFGPIVPGATGHPMASQTIEVFRPGTSGASWGNTGPTGRSITAYFGPPPPSATPVAVASVPFSRYERVALPSSLLLPCGGSGQVTFLSAPLFGARAFVVPVRYVGQP